MIDIPDGVKSDLAADLLPKVMQTVESDLLKAQYYLKQSVKVAIVSKNDQNSSDLARLYVELEELVEKFQKAYRRVVD